MNLLYLSAILYLVGSGAYAFRTFLGLGIKFLPVGILSLAFLLYLIHFFKVYLSTGHFPVGDIYGMVSLVGNFLVAIFLLITFIRGSLQEFGFIVAFIGFLTTLLGLPAQKVGYKTPFYVYHILSAGVAYASLILGGIASLVKMLVERKLKSKHIGGLMVPVNLLRKTERISTNIGFIFLTLTLIFGSLWARSFLGRHWINDPKLILTLILWIYYAIVVHLNLVRGLTPTRFSALSVLGFVLVVGSIAFIRHSVD